MSSIRIDILKLAQDKKAQEDFVQFVANAQNLAYNIPAYRWISKVDYVGPQINPNNVDFTYRFYPDKAVNNAGARNSDRFLQGDCRLSYNINNLMTPGVWSVAIYVNVNPNGTSKGDGEPFLVYFASNVVNTPVEDELVVIEMPFAPIYNVDMIFNTDAAAQLQFQINCQWNGLYFKQG